MASILAIFLAIAIVFALLRLAYRRLDLDKLIVEVSFSKTRVTEGERLALRTVLTNENWLPLPWVALRLRVSRYFQFNDTTNTSVSDYYSRNDLYNILMRQRIKRRFSFVSSKRGFYSITSVELSSWDMLMETDEGKVIPVNAHLTVYPSLLPVPEVDNLCAQIYGQLSSRNIIHPDPLTFRGLREYSPHDPLRAVNFKASAKAQELMVNLWEHVNSREVILLYNLERHSVWHNDVLDEFTIKIVASLADRLSQENIPVRFITNGACVNTATSSVTEIPEGVGELHLERIFEVLALLDVKQRDFAPFHEILAHTAAKHKNQPEYWIISSHHGAELEEEYTQLMAQGARTVWVLPCSVGLRVNENDISLPAKIREQVVFV